MMTSGIRRGGFYMEANRRPTQIRVSHVVPPTGDAAMHDEPSLLEMLERAARYRASARQFSDEQIRHTLTEFAVGLEQQIKGSAAR
jgi:hypothetical protein